MVFSHQTRDLVCFADSSDIPWNPPTIFRPDLSATIPQMSLPSFCALLFRQSHLSQIDEVVDVQWFQHRSSQALPNSKELSVLMTLGFLVGSKNFCKLCSVAWEAFVLHWYDCVHCVAKFCTTTTYRGSEGNSCEELEASRCSGTLSSTRFPLNSSIHSGRSCDKFPRTSTFHHVLYGFSISASPRDEFLRSTSSLILFLVDAGCSVGVTASCDEDAGRIWWRWAWRACRQTRDNGWYVVPPDCIPSFCHFWWDVVSELYQWSSQSFPSARTAAVSSRSITVTNKSNSLTFCCHRRRTFRDIDDFQFGRVQVFAAHHVQAPAGICNKLSFLLVLFWMLPANSTHR